MYFDMEKFMEAWKKQEGVYFIMGGRNAGKTEFYKQFYNGLYGKKVETLLRMQTELDSLHSNIEKCDKVIHECRLQQRNDIPLEDLHLLEEQYMYMIKYEAVLKIRISRMESEVTGAYGYADTDSVKEDVH